MTAPPGTSPARQFPPRVIASYIAAVAALLVFAIGAAVLMGWTFDIEELKGLFPGFIVTIPNTAIGFMFA